MPKHSNSLIVNFGSQEDVDERIVRKQFKLFGLRIKTIVICILDKCQGFITFRDSQPNLIDWIFVQTAGMIFTHNTIWSLHRLGTTVVCPMANDQSTSVSPDISSSTTLVPSSCSSGFLPLPPPYHILPDTPFFRTAKIIPPPPSSMMFMDVDVPLLQRIINSYLDSMELSDMQSLHDIPPELTSIFDPINYPDDEMTVCAPPPINNHCSFFEFCSTLTPLSSHFC